MPNLILIPCSSCKNAANPRVMPPPNDPNIAAFINPVFSIQLDNKRNLLMPFAGIAPGGVSPAFQRYAGNISWQYKPSFVNGKWTPRANPNNHVVIVSAYFGLLNPYSHIPMYNLAMNNSIALPAVGYFGTVKNFWKNGNFLHSVLLNYCAINGISTIHNLLTNDYYNAVQLNTPIPGVTINTPIWTDNYGHHRGKWLCTNL